MSELLKGIQAIEQRLVGNCILHPETIDLLDLTEDDFASPGLGKMFRSLRHLREESFTVEASELAAQLYERLEEIAEVVPPEMIDRTLKGTATAILEAVRYVEQDQDVVEMAAAIKRAAELRRERD